MLLLALSWLVALAASVTIGAAVVARVTLPALDRALVAAWIGLLAVATVLLGASLFAPLSPLVFAIAAAGLGGLALTRRHVRVMLAEVLAAASPAALAVLVIALLAAASAAAQEPALYDTGLYHYPAVRWLASYGSVRGAALFSTYLGYTSSWLALGAAVDGVAPGRMVGFCGGLALLLGSLHAAMAAGRALRGAARLPDWFLLAVALLLLPRLYASPQIASLSPDLPVVFLTVLVCWAMLAGTELLPAVLAAFAATVKLAALPVLAVALLFAWARAGRRALGVALVAAVVLLPWLAASITTSGCLAHPTALTCLDVPWGVGAADAAQIGAIIREWAQWDGPTPSDATALAWIVPWLRADPARTALVAMALLSSALLLVAARRRRDALWPALVSLSVIGIVLGFGPNPRFGLAAFLIPTGLLFARGASAGERPAWLAGGAALASIFQMLGERLLLGALLLGGIALALVLWRHQPRRFVAALLALFVLDAAALHARAYQKQRFRLALVEPPAIRAAVARRLYRSNDLVFTRPVDGDQCWGSPLPCAPWPLRHDLRLRRPELGLAGGFVKR